MTEWAENGAEQTATLQVLSHRSFPLLEGDVVEVRLAARKEDDEHDE